MNCRGRSVFDGEWIELEFDRLLQSAEPVLGVPPASGEWIAPGFIDLQVNGFAGVDPLMSPAMAAARADGVAQAPDGSLYIGDSQKGKIWRVIYRGSK